MELHPMKRNTILLGAGAVIAWAMFSSNASAADGCKPPAITGDEDKDLDNYLTWFEAHPGCRDENDGANDIVPGAIQGPDIKVIGSAPASSDHKLAIAAATIGAAYLAWKVLR
jgi:hypothetical protein